MQRIIQHTKKVRVLLLLATLLLLHACKEKDFMFALDDLLETQWGIPQIIEPGMTDPVLDAPTIFYGDGVVSFGPNRYDYWQVRGERSIFIEQAKENWFIIKLNPDTLYVEKTRQPDGTFLGKFMYNPMTR